MESPSAARREKTRGRVHRWSGRSCVFVLLTAASLVVLPASLAQQKRTVGLADPGLAYFSVARDSASLIPMLQQARQVNPQIKLLATPWSAPGWMKFGGTFAGNCTANTNYNYLRNDLYGTYAQYFVRYVQAYQAAGLPIWMVSMQNEPHNCQPSFPTMNMTASDEAAFAPVLRQALDGAGLGAVRILAWDHNWTDNNAPATYAQTVLSNGAAFNAVQAVGYHCYSGADQAGSVQDAFRTAFPTKDVYMTECSGGSWATIAAANLLWEVKNLLIVPTVHGSKASFYFNAALDPNGNPHYGGCGTCRGMVTVNPDGSFTPNEEYYAWGHFSRFVQPGASVIGSTDLTSQSIWNVAFKNPDGTIVLVVENGGAFKVPVQVHLDKKRLTYPLPGGSVATLTWTPGANAAHVWLTSTANGTLTSKLAQQADVLLTDAPKTSPSIDVNPTAPRQTMDGFGVAMTDSSASLIKAAASPAAILEALFGASGNRLNLIRTPMGSTDMSSTEFSYDEAPAGAYRGHIVQWDGDRSAQKFAWLVGPDLRRRWISDVATYNCLKTTGTPGPDLLVSALLDQPGGLLNFQNVWAVCGADRVGVNSMLQRGAYARSSNGAYTLTMQQGGNLVLTDSGGGTVWQTGTGNGNFLVLQGDGNLVEYTAGGSALWASGTAGSGAAWFVVRNDGKLALYNGGGALVWTNEVPRTRYAGHIVQWDGDTNAQKTAWLVGPDLRRRWISDISTYNCLKARSAPGPDVLTSWMLDQLPDFNNVWAVCDDSRIGVNSMLQRGFDARSDNGIYHLELQSGDGNLVEYKGSSKVCWATNRYGADFLILQSDGNLVAYTNGGQAVWASSTVGRGGVWFSVQDDGNMVLYNAGGTAVWATNTAGC